MKALLLLAPLCFAGSGCELWANLDSFHVGGGGTGGAVTTSTTDCAPIDDENACTEDVCEGGVPVNNPFPAGSPCFEGGTKCDGKGRCVECLSPDECAGADGECQTRTCEEGACGVHFTPIGTAASEQVAEDCQERQCDGAGKIIAVADGEDIEVDDNPCTYDECNGASPVHPIKPAGTPCGVDLMCDQGKCVGCLGPADCPAPDTPCLVATCVDGVCGTAESPGTTSCDDGDACTQTDTCAAGSCVGSNPVVCAPLNQCHLAGTCDPATGICSNPMKNNGAPCDDDDGCTANDGCQGGACQGAPSCPSCSGLSPTCGQEYDESCCTSRLVTGGTFHRSNDPASPATVSAFRLDRFEITVARFREFLNGYPANKPAAGAGAHPLISGSGWNAAWPLPATAGDLAAAVSCEPSLQTWDGAPGANDDLPMNCLDWYVAFALCAWDGGRLPTEAEWNYAAAAGAEQRSYPWGASPPDATRAVYGCMGDGTASCAFADILAPGSRSPQGDGLWTQADLAGNLWEWNLDYYAASYPASCVDCANLTPAGNRTIRGGGYASSAPFLVTSIRNFDAPSKRSADIGVRCARSP